MTAEELFARLNQLLLELDKSAGSEYVRTADLCSSITEALSPRKVSIEFPKALYRGTAMTTVNSREEETQALVEGFSYAPPALFEAGYPQWWIENPTHADGTRRAAARGILLRSSEEFERFQNVVEIDGWREDAIGMYGVRVVGLDELIAARRAMLRALIDAEPFSAAAVEVEAADTPAPVVEDSASAAPTQAEETPSTEEVRGS
jgi:hypothetical protein